MFEPEKANGHSLPRDSWKKLLGVVSESGQVTSLFGDSEGVVISFRYFFVFSKNFEFREIDRIQKWRLDLIG